MKTKQPPCTEWYALWCEMAGKLNSLPTRFDIEKNQNIL